jgi:hypothetical protein
MKPFNIVVIGCSALMLGACSHVKETLGMERTAPDEFAVIERAPLTVPPNFDLLPPADGSVPVPNTTTETAKGLVLGSQSSAPKPGAGSAAEQALLSKANAAQGDPAIRQQLAGPDTTPGEATTVGQKLGITSVDENGKALDATKEAGRLKKSNVKAPPVVVKDDDVQ